MTTAQITIATVYAALQRLQHELEEVKAHLESTTENSDEGDSIVLADESLLSECWLSDEDEAAFAYLQ